MTVHNRQKMSCRGPPVQQHQHQLLHQLQERLLVLCVASSLHCRGQ
jgi:hypothetical protein